MSYEYSEMELKLRAACEEGYAVGPMGNGPTAPTGERYRELVNPAMKGVASEQEVYELALATFRKHVAGKTGTIYWRVVPEIARDNKGWKFYMRVLVSDKVARDDVGVGWRSPVSAPGS